MPKSPDWEFMLNLAEVLCELGQSARGSVSLQQIEPFKHYHLADGPLDLESLDERDGPFSRREILARYLLLGVVLDQGPDIVGVQQLLDGVLTDLYRHEVRILHKPSAFFNELGISIDRLVEKNSSIKQIRAEEWARLNQASASRYSLFFAQSQRGIVAGRVLDYAVHRWGTPLCLPLLLQKDLEDQDKESEQPLVDHLESFPSAELASKGIKDHERYGLGSAIGDKACHLFVKKYVSVFGLGSTDASNKGWTGVSYELPLDSNVGRVLFRTGLWLQVADLAQLMKWRVVRDEGGKGSAAYIRVTDIRGKKAQNIVPGSAHFETYEDIVRDYLCVGKRPRTLEIQRMPNVLVYELNKSREGRAAYSVADFDDGLIEVGTRHCFNHDEPECADCPLGGLCVGKNVKPELISGYRT
jgi:hypothetical protein